MPRRCVEYSTPDHMGVVDAKTGRIVEAPALPIICVSIRHYRLKLGIEQKELAGRIGVQKSAISNWENGRGRPDLNLIPALCRELKVTPYDLFGMAEPEALYSPREERLIQNYRKLEDKLKAHVDVMIDSLVQTQDTDLTPELFAIKYHPIRLAAGPDAGIRDITETETLYLRDCPLLHRSKDVYSVNGDSMEPTFHNGDLVFVEHIPNGPPLRFGEIGAFAIGNECFIKEYQPDGLHSHNPNYELMRFDADAASVYLIGRVLGVVDPDLIPSEEIVQRFLQESKQEE